jgi:hypothetical protein
MGIAFKSLNAEVGSFSQYEKCLVEPAPGPLDIGTTVTHTAFGTFLKGTGMTDEFSLCMGTPSKPDKLF